MQIFGNNLYRAYLDGNMMVEGPARFERNHPEYDELSVELTEGKHIFTVIVHYFGVSTRFSVEDIDPFMQFSLTDSKGSVPLEWKCKEIDAYYHLGRRVNGQVGWMEYCDTRLLPGLDSVNTGPEWVKPVEVNIELGAYQPKSITDCLTIPVKGALIGQGAYINRFGYDNDDPPVRFMLRDLTASSLPSPLPSEGVWSHCHAWSGCPAWQLSRHVLGLLPDETGNPYRFIWFPKPGNLEFAEGDLPFVNGTGRIQLKWVRQGDTWNYTLLSDHPIQVRFANEWEISDIYVDGNMVNVSGEICVQQRLSLVFSKAGVFEAGD